MKIPVHTRVPDCDGLELPDVLMEPKIHLVHDVYIYNNLLFIPDYQPSYDFINYYSNETPDSFFNRFKDKLPIESDRVTLFASNPWIPSYSHYTLQCIGTLLLAREMGILSKDIQIIAPSSARFMKELLEKYSFSDENFFQLKPHTLYRFSNLVYSDLYYYHTYIFPNIIHPKLVNLYATHSEPADQEPNYRIYISRKSKKNRSVRNEDEVIEFFKKRGFAIVDFDVIPVKEQIEHVQRASEIAASHGGSGVNLLYKQQDEFTFTEFYANRFYPWHANILFSKNCRYSAVRNQTEGKSKDAVSTIDLELAGKALAEPSWIFSSADLPKRCETEFDSKSQFDCLIRKIYENHFFRNIDLVDLPRASLLTYHRTFVSISTHKTELIQMSRPFEVEKDRFLIQTPEGANLEAIYCDSRICLHAPALKRYISAIDDSGRVALSYNRVFFQARLRYDHYLSILVNGKYLSAREDGSFSLVNYIEKWETFYLIW